MLRSLLSALPCAPSGIFILAILAGMVLVCFAGCKTARQKPLRDEDIHRITHEFVVAANSVVPPGSEIHGEVGAFEKVANSADRLEIQMLAKREGGAYPPAVVKVMQALHSIATTHGLTQESGHRKRRRDRFQLPPWRSDYPFDSHPHGNDARNAPEPPAGAGGTTNQAARLAIILDDLGNDRRPRSNFALPYPLTISILPKHPHSQEIASQAHRRGYRVMLHLPMQSMGKEHPEAQELRSQAFSRQCPGW